MKKCVEEFPVDDPEDYSWEDVYRLYNCSPIYG
jgi:hypothetical protein